MQPSIEKNTMRPSVGKIRTRAIDNCDPSILAPMKRPSSWLSAAVIVSAFSPATWTAAAIWAESWASGLMSWVRRIDNNFANGGRRPIPIVMTRLARHFAATARRLVGSRSHWRDNSRWRTPKFARRLTLPCVSTNPPLWARSARCLTARGQLPSSRRRADNIHGALAVERDDCVLKTPPADAIGLLRRPAGISVSLCQGCFFFNKCDWKASHMRAGIRLTVSGLVLASIIVSAVGVHILWWRTAEANSHALADTINAQIDSTVEKELTTITTEARAAHTAIRTLFRSARTGDPRSGQARVRLSFATSVATGHFMGRVRLARRNFLCRAQTRRSRTGNDGNRTGWGTRSSDASTNMVLWLGTSSSRNADSRTPDYVVTDQEWYRGGIQADEPRWFNVSVHPVGSRPSIAYAGPIDVYGKRQGVLAVIIEYTRFAQFLSNLSVGKSGAAFILERDGRVIAAPDPDADEVQMQRSDQPLLPIAQGAMRQAGSSYDVDKKIASQVRLVAAGRCLCGEFDAARLSRMDARDCHSGSGVSRSD